MSEWCYINVVKWLCQWPSHNCLSLFYLFIYFFIIIIFFLLKRSVSVELENLLKILVSGHEPVLQNPLNYKYLGIFLCLLVDWELLEGSDTVVYIFIFYTSCWIQRRIQNVLLYLEKMSLTEKSLRFLNPRIRYCSFIFSYLLIS